MNKSEKIVELYNNNKSLSNSEIAKRTGTSKRHVRRVLNPIREKKIDKMPKILVFDIETSPLLSNLWGVYEQRVPLENIQKEWFVISWSGKYLFDSNIMSDVLSPKEAINSDDKRILKSMWKLLDESDIIIGHNILKFDIRKLNARFIMNGLPSPSPYKTIDTLRVCKKQFAFTGYSLNYINKILGLRGKAHTSYNLWLRCMKGDKEALKTMVEYNKRDVVITEDLYVKIRGWIRSDVNMGLYFDTDEALCPNCGNSNLEWKGYYYTTMNRFRSGKCLKCNAIFRSRYSDLSKEERKMLLSPVAR